MKGPRTIAEAFGPLSWYSVRKMNYVLEFIKILKDFFFPRRYSSSHIYLQCHLLYNCPPQSLNCYVRKASPLVLLWQRSTWNSHFAESRTLTVKWDQNWDRRVYKRHCLAPTLPILTAKKNAVQLLKRDLFSSQLRDFWNTVHVT